MKTTLFLLCFMFGMSMANAQYYFTTYGSQEGCHSGIKTIGPDGYMLVGDYWGGSALATSVVWTDVDGSISTGFHFNRAFTFHSSGTNYNSRATEVIKNAINNHFYVAGWVEMSGMYFPYMMDLDNAGNFISCIVYTFANSNTLNQVKITTANDATGDMYMTSHHDYGGGVQSIIAFRVDEATGNVIWTNVYDIFDSQQQIQSAQANAIVESPWGPGNELYIFGYSIQGTTGTSNPTVIIINGSTGALATVPVIQHQYGVDAQYLSCAISNDFQGGFVAAGVCKNGPGITDVNALTINMTPMGAKNWCTMHDNSVNPGAYNNANGVKERYVGLTKRYETYTAGIIYNQAPGSAGTVCQTQVLKIDDTGNLINEFLISSGRNEFGEELDLDPNGNGLAVFGTLTTGTTSDMYTAKMYFNGEMPCYKTVSSFASTHLNFGIEQPSVIRTALFPTTSSLNATITSLSEHRECFDMTVNGGSNAKTNKQGDQATVKIGFNLRQAGSNISIEPADNAQQTDIRYLINVYDLAGRNVLSTDLRILPGQHDMIDFASYGLKQGYYLLVVTNNGRTQSLKVFKEQ